MSYSSEVLADSPYIYWRLGDASGGPTDSSGNSRAAAAVGSPTYSVAGPLVGDANTAMSFSGTGQYLTWTTTDAYTGDYSIEFWAKFTNFTVYPGVFGSRTQTSGNYGFAIEASTGGALDVLVPNSTFTGWTSAQATGVTLSTGTWYHIVVTLNSSTKIFKVYMNGAQSGGDFTFTTASGFVNTGKVLRVASSGTQNTGLLTGSMDEVAIYRTVLSASRVLAHYGAGAGNVTVTATGPSVLDLAGQSFVISTYVTVTADGPAVVDLAGQSFTVVAGTGVTITATGPGVIDLAGQSFTVAIPAIARPDSTVTAGGWAPLGGPATLWGAISETVANDADYCRRFSSGSFSSDRMEVGLTDVTDPASSSDHILRYRIGKGSIGGQGVNFVIELRQGSTVIATWSHNDSPTFDVSTTVTFTQTLSGAQADSITDYTDLRFGCAATGDGATPTRSPQLTWAEFQVPAPMPADVLVTATGPTVIDVAGQPFTVTAGADIGVTATGPGVLDVAGQSFAVDVVANVTVTATGPAVLDLAGASFAVDAVSNVIATADGPATVDVAGQSFSVAVSSNTAATGPALVDLGGQSFVVSTDVNVGITGPAVTDLVGQSFTVTTDAIVAAGAATIDVAGQSFTVDTTSDATITATGPVTVDLDGQAFTVTATSDVTVVADGPATAQLVGQDFTVFVGAGVTATADGPAVVDVAGQVFTVDTTANVSIDAVGPAVIDLVGQDFIVSASGDAVIVAAGPAVVDLAGQPFEDVGGADIEALASGPALIGLIGQPFTVLAIAGVTVTAAGPAVIDVAGGSFSVYTPRVASSRPLHAQLDPSLTSALVEANVVDADLDSSGIRSLELV